MAPGLIAISERRVHSRWPPQDLRCSPDALLRPGHRVTIINVGSGGALLESATRISPGGRAELQISDGSRRYLHGRIARCRVSRLTPLCYQAAIVFDAPFELAGGDASAG